MDNMGSVLRARRKELGLTMKDVAEAVGVSPAYVWRLEKGRSQPSRATGKSLALVLHIAEDMMYRAAGWLPEGEQLFLTPEEHELIDLYRQAVPALRAATLAGLRAGMEHRAQRRRTLQEGPTLLS